MAQLDTIESTTKHFNMDSSNKIKEVYLKLSNQRGNSRDHLRTRK